MQDDEQNEAAKRWKNLSLVDLFLYLKVHEEFQRIQSSMRRARQTTGSNSSTPSRNKRKT